MAYNFKKSLAVANRPCDCCMVSFGQIELEDDILQTFIGLSSTTVM